MATYEKPITLGDIVKKEVSPESQRETIVMASGKSYKIGTVLGRLRGSGTVVVGAGVADSGNAGNGTLTLAGTPATAEVKEGKYRIAFTSATKANVEDPNGVNIGAATVGAAFNKEIAFTLAAGGTPFAAGDAWTVAASFPANDGLCDEWDPAATTGVSEVYGVLLWPVDATSGPVKTAALVRGPAMLADDLLIFKNGLSAAQISDGLAGLSAKGLAIRETI